MENEPKHKVDLYMTILLVLVSALIFGVLGFAYGQQIAKESAALESSTASVNYPSESTATTSATASSVTSTSASATASTTSTADWKTYTNSEYGFSFKYPGDYTKNDLENGVAINSGTSGGYERPNLITVQKTKTDKTFAQFLQTLNDGRTFFEQTATTFAGKSAYEGVDAGLVNSYGVYTESNGNIFGITLESGNKDTLTENKSALTETQKTILSTFQFTSK